ncbi:TM2 domain-containing protein [Mycoplasma sp. P36-A1]|uniref:TM2 domain-containing protein n=1 Tax=Mycoplasma sp. P36-A1 TaxID=3252900 RepID=UPI003C2F4ABE
MQNDTCENVIIEKPKSKLIALLLWFFLGAFGAHNFYREDKTIGIFQLILNIVGWLTLGIMIGILLLVALGIWLLVDLIFILTTDTMSWDLN